MKYILHNYRRCPFCIRVRILLHLKEISYSVIEEPLRVWTPWMKQWSEASNERPRIPILRELADDGAEAIYAESNDINLYLDTAIGSPQYTPTPDTPQHKSMHNWFRWCDDEFKHQIDTFKYGENLQFNAAKHADHTAKLSNMVQTLEDTLQETEYLTGSHLTLADIAIIPFVRQIMRTRGGEFNFTNFPHVQNWTDTIITTDWFIEDVMKKHPLAASTREE